MSPFESWALLLLAAATLVMLLRVHYLTGRPLHVCPWCDRGYRGEPSYVLDNWLRPTHACCSAECADNLNESIWLGQQP